MSQVDRPPCADSRRNRERILAGAGEVFARLGDKAQIAARCGLGMGTLYRRYPSKRDLLTAVVRQPLRAWWIIRGVRNATGCVREYELAAPGELVASGFMWRLCARHEVVGVEAVARKLDDPFPAIVNRQVGRASLGG